jgi:hypothetical protein
VNASFAPPTSAAVCAGSPAPSASRARPSPHGSKKGYTDFWEAYRSVVPAEQRTAAGKETGLTAHVERWNNTLRQRLGRFVGKSLSFSKSEMMHELCLRLFLHDYNHSPALSYG